MPTSDLERFIAYAQVFEVAYWADAWSGLDPFLCDDVRHVVHGAAPLAADDRGRAAFVDGLRTSVHSIDRRFDVRIPEVLEGPLAREDGVWMRFSLALRRAGLPDLCIRGEHLVRYEGGRIALIEETIEPGVGERVAAYLAEHAGQLRPSGSPPSPPADPRDAADLDGALLRTLVRCYGSAKSQQDIGAALAVCSEDFRLETVAMGIEARGREEVEGQLETFFTAFPDYGVDLEGIATAAGVVTCWGRARMTWRGPFLGHAPSGKRADLPIFCVFPCADGKLRGERFFFDLASLCDQIDLPLAAVRQALDVLRGSEARGAA
jgi:predicted ester cyclase